MRFCYVLICGICGMLVWGCAREAPRRPVANNPASTRTSGQGKTASTNNNFIVTPGGQLTGRVASVNPISRFVIATFPLGAMPAVEQRLGVFREGLKVGEIKITGPQRDINIAGDIIAGECRPGDEVKLE